MMSGRFFVAVCLVLVVAPSASAQWQPIEGSHYDGSVWGNCLFYDEKTDDIGIYDADYQLDQITSFWDIGEQEWEEIDRIEMDWLIQDERFGTYFEATTGNIFFSKKLNKWINVCAIWFDGDGRLPSLFEVWELTNDGWQELQSNTYLDVLGDYLMAADREGKILMLNGTRTKRKTCLFDGIKWHKINIHGPTERADASMAYDDKRGEFVLFGGWRTKKINIHIYFNDTWIFASNRWRRVKPENSPRARSGSYMFYHPKIKQVLLYGGYSQKFRKKSGDWEYIYYSDIWRWNGKRWTRMVKNTEVDGKSIRGPMTYDSKRDRMIALYKGKLWEYRFSNIN